MAAPRNERLSWIDIAKAIGIMAVVLGHNPYVQYPPGKIWNIVFSFDIPLLFFLSGFLFDPNVPFRNLLGKRAGSLLKPYLFAVFWVSLVYAIFKKNHSFFSYLFWALYANGPNLPKDGIHLWFLPHLLIVNIFVWGLYKCIGESRKIVLVQLLLVPFMLVLGVALMRSFWDVEVPTLGLFARNQGFMLQGFPWSLDIILLTSSFFIAGNLVKQNKWETIFQRKSVVILAFALFASLHYFYNYTVDLNFRRFDNILVCTILAYAGIYISMYLAAGIATWSNMATQSLQYIGRYSLIIYILHPVLQADLSYRVIEKLSSIPPYAALIPSFIAGVGMPLVINYFIIERFKHIRLCFYAK